LQHTAYVTTIEAQVLAKILCGVVLAMRNLVEHTDFSQREPAIEKVLLQDTDLTRVEAIEAANSLDGVGGGWGVGCSGHGNRIIIIVDLVNSSKNVLLHPDVIVSGG